MVLNFGSMQSIFPQSSADGAGLVPDIIVKRILDGDTGPSVITLLHTNDGNTAATIEEQVDTITLGNGTFTAREELFIVIETFKSGGAGEGQIKLRIADSSGSAETQSSITLGARQVITFNLQQVENDNTYIRGLKHVRDTTGADSVGVADFNLTDANLITTSFTVSLRAWNSTSGTTYWKWWIYKRGVIVTS